MHASMKRLHQVSGRFKRATIAKDLGFEPFVVTEWSTKGVSIEGANMATLIYGAHANYILTGDLPDGISSIKEMLEAFPNNITTPSGVHPSMERLHLISKLMKNTDIADALGVSKGSVTNWANRGVSSSAAIAASQVYGIDANYILKGVLPAGITQTDIVSDFTIGESIKSNHTDGSLDRLKKVSGRYKRSELASDLEVTPTTVSNWASAGVSKSGAEAAEKLYGLNADYIRTGVLPDGIATFDDMMAAYPIKKPYAFEDDNYSESDDEHESLIRLLEVSGRSKKSEIGSDLDISAATLSNWATRGVSREGALAAAALYHTDANYILTGASAADSNGRMAVTTEATLSLNNSGHGVVKLRIDGRVEKPSYLSKNSFALKIDTPNMMPEFKIGDYAFVEVKIKEDELKHLDFVVVQPKSGGIGVLKQILFGGRRSDAYLIDLNMESATAALPLSECFLIGKVVTKISYYL